MGAAKSCVFRGPRIPVRDDFCPFGSYRAFLFYAFSRADPLINLCDLHRLTLVRRQDAAGATLSLVLLRRTKTTVMMLRRNSAGCSHCLKLVQFFERNSRIAAAWNADTRQGTHGSRGLILMGASKAE